MLIRGDDPPETPPDPGGTTRPPRPPGAPPPGGMIRPWGADRAVQRRVGRVHQPSLYLQVPVGEQVESGLLAVLIVGRGPFRLKHGWRGDRSAAGRCAPRCPAAVRTAGTAAGPPTRSWPHAGRRRGRRPALSGPAAPRVRQRAGLRPTALPARPIPPAPR